SWNRNKVTKLFQHEPFSVGLYSTSRVEEGRPLSEFYTLRFLGVDPATGDAIFDDINNDGVIDAADRVFVGSPHPKYWGGLTNTPLATEFYAYPLARTFMVGISGAF